jgi:hypothetical protein
VLHQLSDHALRNVGGMCDLSIRECEGLGSFLAGFRHLSPSGESSRMIPQQAAVFTTTNWLFLARSW